MTIPCPHCGQPSRAQAHGKAGASNGDAGPNAELMRRNSAPAMQIPPLAGGDPRAAFCPGLAVSRCKAETVAHFDPDRGLGGTGGYSRIDLARPKVPAFAGTRRPLDVSSSQLGRLGFGLAGPFWGICRASVGEPGSRILISNPINTHRTSSPKDLNAVSMIGAPACPRVRCSKLNMGAFSNVQKVFAERENE